MAHRALVHNRAGSPNSAFRTSLAARRLVEGIPGEAASRVVARLDYLMSIVRLSQGKPREAGLYAGRAAGAAREIGDSDTLIRALLASDSADRQLGRSGIGARTKEALEISMARADAQQESVARANLGVYAFYAGRWEEAVDWLATSSQVAIGAGNHFGAAETDVSLADILIYQGRLDEAEDVLRSATRVLRASGIEGFTAYAGILQARIHLARGELVAAEDDAGAAMDEFADMDSAVDVLEAAIVKAEAILAQGRPDEALQIVNDAQSAARGEGESLRARSQLVRARALLPLGRVDEARVAIEDGLSSAREQDLPYEEALLLRARGQWRVSVDQADARAAQADALESARLLEALGARA